MNDATLTIVILAAITYVLKAAGPIVLGGRALSPRIERVIGLLPAALLAALIVTSTLANGVRWSFDARIVGVAAAAIALWRRLPFVAVVIVAGAATALVRLA